MSEPGRVPWTLIDGGIALRVRVTPKSSVDVVAGPCETPDGPALAVKVRALPADGAANRAVEKLVAEWIGVPKSAAGVRTGGKSRVKLLHVIGDAATLVQVVGRKLQDIGRGN